MSGIDNSFDIELAGLLMNNNAIKSNNQSFNVNINSYGIYEFSCDGYTYYSQWVNSGIY